MWGGLKGLLGTAGGIAGRSGRRGHAWAPAASPLLPPACVAPLPGGHATAPTSGGREGPRPARQRPLAVGGSAAEAAPGSFPPLITVTPHLSSPRLKSRALKLLPRARTRSGALSSREGEGGLRPHTSRLSWVTPLVRAAKGRAGAAQSQRGADALSPPRPPLTAP